jgi:hypothetical protein
MTNIKITIGEKNKTHMMRCKDGRNEIGEKKTMTNNKNNDAL